MSQPRFLPLLRAALGLTLLALMISYVGGSELAAHWGSLKWPWLIVTTLCIITATFLGGINIALLLHGHEAIPLHRLFPAYWAAWAIGLIVPGQVGDMAALSTWLRRYGLNWHLGLGCTLLDKLISLVILAAFGLWGLIIVVGVQKPTSTVVFWILTAFLILIIVLVSRRQALLTWMQQGQGLLSQTLHTLLTTTTHYPWRVAANLGLTILKATLIGFSYWCMFAALGQQQIDPITVVALAAASSLVAYIPISFNGLGTVELTGIALFSTLGLSEPLVLSAYLALRVTGLVLAWGPVLIWLGFSRQPIDKALSQGQGRAGGDR